jgi:hypothetical protein
MKKLYMTCIASMIALGSMSAFAADVAGEEQSELWQRANALQAERQRNPDWDGGTRRVSESRGDVKLNQNQGEVKNQNRAEVKPKAHSGKPKTKTERAKSRLKRTAKDFPGALVRNR